ncbi:MAG: hypothetical protein JJU45_05390 [Acidimicrobiia bacterium]|nr:hypothetical protein [Acidimicrobiia bacterium]
MQPVDRALLDEAVAITRAAGELTLEWFRSPALEVERKGDGTPVTAADKAAERFLREAIEQRWPDDAVNGEEEADTEGSSGRTWILDPIDGTKAFTRGIPLYTNLVALNDADGPAVGIINVPAIGLTVYAGRGLGCFENDRPARVSDKATLEAAYVSTCSYSRWPDEALLALRHSGCAMRTWGDGYGYALVAAGRIDAMVDPEVAPWDIAPMPVILAEAGGRFTDLRGQDTIDGGDGIATNGKLHDELLALMGRA